MLDMTYWPARTYLKIIDHKFTVQRECGNGPLQARLSGDVIILRGCVRRNSGPSGGRENRHGYYIMWYAFSRLLRRAWVYYKIIPKSHLGREIYLSDLKEQG